ncbi:hypothetical protein DNTS_013775 [Danionella cerebrum]|uniref:Uncharacterized protein n=1 Tax=Danionella cerebrum TaxID=2873325 RepID=A0A553NIU9_9TELE|nr:hypothetical protein DNTS_013775 [Danionella translucida]TRY65373.1 hypothetical protein DNTS_013775 [Danionella translucida]
MDRGDEFILFKIFIPIVIFGVLSVCCAGFCKMFQRVRNERIERLQAQARAMDQTSVYVIPISLAEDELHRPPRYSTVQFYESPPAYNELSMKPEGSPLEPPPSYSESIYQSEPSSTTLKALSLTAWFLVVMVIMMPPTEGKVHSWSIRGRSTSYNAFS